jgi:hypothetical protein
MIRFALRYFPVTTTFVLFLLARAAFATAHELPPVLGNTPGASALPAQQAFDLNAFLGGLPPWAQAALIAGVTAIAGYIGSVVVSFWSDYVRRLGSKAKPWMLSLSAALNIAAGNPHKAARAAKAAKKEPQP